MKRGVGRSGRGLKRIGHDRKERKRKGSLRMEGERNEREIRNRMERKGEGR